MVEIEWLFGSATPYAISSYRH